MCSGKSEGLDSALTKGLILCWYNSLRLNQFMVHFLVFGRCDENI